MGNDDNQVEALKEAILKRAQQLAAEHEREGEMTRDKIIKDTREKIKLMEEKELLAAKVQADREYQRKVQASELHMQAEQDRNRWGLVQSVLDAVEQQISELYKDKELYEKMFRALLKQSVEKIGHVSLVAHLNPEDLNRLEKDWEQLVKECCGKNVKIRLSKEICDCSGGFKLVSEAGDIMLDNTFEGLLLRKNSELQRLIFERLFSSVNGKGVHING
ncbi:MAG: V-type ATP synthase subunit E family protein [Gammaproteobacteria bacterium]|nr:V-type ATP synthase subunit E family protein [Gammaproteobacteria bacterium]